jgi:hypothetical protein
MPTRKQRRRQKKARRHEYEYVYIDDEGNEVAVDPTELRAEKDGHGHKANGRPRQSDDRRPAARKTAAPGRRVEPPSWRRSFRRALILGPVLIAAMMLLNRNVPLAEQIAPAVVMVAFFVPFSYFTDRIAYRMYLKRSEGRAAPKRR